MISSPATSQSTTCARCGGEIISDAAFRQCPRCLLDLALSCKSEVASQDAFANGAPSAHEDAEFDYEVLERIGRGGMGVVYRARQRSLNRIVALKMIAVGDFASPSALARFRREAETAAKLDHPNIVSIIEIGERDSNPFLVMRYVEGDSLAGALKDIALPQKAKGADAQAAQIRIARLVATVARAVDYAHARGVLHRDLKPSNILLDLDGNPHLTDFGIAKSLDHESGLTQTAELLGTLAYMPPEQAAGKPLSRSADIYSLGAILYELLTAHPPFEGPKMVVLQNVLTLDPPTPQLINAAIASDLATICLKCLDKDPLRRYRSARELAEDIDRWLQHEPILAREAGPFIRLERWSKRNPAVATLLVTLSIGVAVSLGLFARANEQKNRKSIALDILRTESARQLQDIWSSANSFFAIKSETLAAMAGMELDRLADVEHRYTIALVADGNPLDRILRAAPVLHDLEASMSASAENPTRLDLRLYKNQPNAVEDLVKGQIDVAQLNAREFLRARQLDARIKPLITIAPSAGHSQGAVIFTRKDTGITNLSGLNGRSFLLSRKDSSLSFWTKVSLADAEVRAKDLAKYRYLDGEEDLLPGGASTLASEVGNPFSSMTPVEAVLAGLYDAAVVRERRFREVATEHNLIALHRFQDTGDFLVAGGRLPVGDATMFQNVLMALNGSESDQGLIDAPAIFKAASESDFEAMSVRLNAETEFEQ